jgi:GNAT superfamily N-acetyltransferase
MLATTPELSRRVEEAASEYLLQRYSGPGNPMGAQVLKRGTMFATKVPFLPQNGLMNSVHGLDDPALLPDVLAFYAATEQPCWITVPPYLSTAVTDALAAAGFAVESYSSAMVAEPVPASPRSEFEVREISRGELDVFLDTMNIGFDQHPAMLANLRRNQNFWCDVADWHLFLACVDGQPAGAAVLSVHGEIGYLAACAVLPAFRARGVHAALIAARFEKARARQCRIVCGNAAWGSQSQRNQQRAGLVIAYVKSIWTNQRARSAPSTT